MWLNFFFSPKKAHSEATTEPPSTSFDKMGDPLSEMPPDPLTPIQYDNFSREFQAVTQQDNFDGFRLEAGKTVSKHLQASHSLFMGTSLRESGYMYQFGPTFAFEDGSFIALARYGIDGVTNGRIIATLPNNIIFKANMNSSLFEENRTMYELSTEYAAKQWASSFKLAWQGAWIFNSSYSQVIAPKLQMGCDMTYVSSNGASIGGVSVRYADKDYVFTMALNRQPDFKSMGPMRQLNSTKLQFVKKITPRLSMACEYEYSHPDKESAMRFGYDYTFRQARVQGLIDTCGRVSVMAQDVSGMGLSGMIDYWTGDYKFGFMMQVYPPTEQAQQPVPNK